MEEKSPFRVEDKQHYEDHAWVKAVRDSISTAGRTVGVALVRGMVLAFIAFCLWLYKVTSGSIK